MGSGLVASNSEPFLVSLSAASLSRDPLCPFHRRFTQFCTHTSVSFLC